MPLINSDDRIPLKALLKRFVLIYLSVMAIFLGALMLSIRFDDQRRLERLEERESSLIEITKWVISHDFSEVNANLRVVASQPALRLYLDSGNAAQREEVANLFLVLSREAGSYDQVRYIDASGQEVIRVDYNDGDPAIVPQDQLQNKAERYYFRDTLKLNQGETFVSPLDLNIEHDRLEIPHKPVIRFGTPVFDSQGNKKGVILLNYLGGELIQFFRNSMKMGDGHSAMLLNRDGYWLSSPKPEDEWGFMLGKSERTFGHDFPAEWRDISAGEQGTLRTAKGLFVYTTVYPLSLGQHSSTGSVLARAPSERELTAQDYLWKIVSFIPHEALSRAAFYNQTDVRILFVIACLAIAAAAWIIAVVTLSRRQAQIELLDALAQAKRFSDAMNVVPAYVYIKNKQHQYVYGNRLVLDLFKCSAEELTGSSDEKFFPPLTVARLKEVDDRVLERGETTQEEIEVATGTPDHRVYWEVKHPIRDDHGEIVGICGISTDITERKQVEQTLALHAELVRHMAEGMVLIRTGDGVIVFANPAFERMFGYEPGELAGKSVAALNAPSEKSPEEIAEAINDRLRQTGVWNGEIENIKKDGMRFWCLANVSTFVHPQYGEVWLSIHQDITERKKLERELERQARTDVLTGLNNRRHFFELAEQELARVRRHAEPLSLLVLDLDRFKSVNDTYGHAVGDEVLKKLGEVSLHTMREIDILGRLGGEEFVVLLPETTGERALEVAERLRSAIADAAVPLEDGSLLRFTVSIGVTSLAATDTTVGAMIKRADAAMYKAKNEGRNRVCSENVA